MLADTDMAQEMSSLVKNQILLSSGTAMLAQANQVPQSVLQLLNSNG
jgi:flagellin